MRAAHPMEDPFQQPREFHTDLMSPSLLSDLKQPRGPYGTPVAQSHINYQSHDHNAILYRSPIPPCGNTSWPSSTWDSSSRSWDRHWRRLISTLLLLSHFSKHPQFPHPILSHSMTVGFSTPPRPHKLFDTGQSREHDLLFSSDYNSILV